MSAGRKAQPSLAVIDTQSVKCVAVRGPRGFDAAKKVPGCKRVALVDADGTWLAVAVVPGSVQDRDCLEALTAGKQAWPSLREAVLDGAFTAERCREWSNLHGMRHRVVEREPDQKGFVVLGAQVGRRAQLRLARALGRAAPATAQAGSTWPPRGWPASPCCPASRA